VTGNGSVWDCNNNFVVGLSGDGDLTVADGGAVSALSLILGNNASSNGVASVAGTGSTISTTSSVTVANSGEGSLRVSSGGELDVGGDLSILDPAGTPQGTLTLDGGSIYVSDHFTNDGVFNFIDGLLRVAGNFQPNPASGTFTIEGESESDLPTLELLGFGPTTSNITSELRVGDARRGQLILGQGRILDVSGNVEIGAQAGSEGIVNVEGGARLTATGTVAVGGDIGLSPGGAGSLTIRNGTLECNSLFVYGDATINFDGGIISIVNSFLGGQFNWGAGQKYEEEPRDPFLFDLVNV